LASSDLVIPLALTAQVDVTSDGQLMRDGVLATVRLMLGSTLVGILDVAYIMEGETPQDVAERTVAECLGRIFS
jgi:hypothetical protein